MEKNWFVQPWDFIFPGKQALQRFLCAAQIYIYFEIDLKWISKF